MGKSYGFGLKEFELNIRTKIALIVFVFSFLIVSAQARSLGGYAGSFLRVGLGADRVAMGDCGVGLNNSGMLWYYNAAGLPHLTKIQALLNYRHMSLDRSLMYAGFAMPVKPNAGVAAGVMRAGIGNIDARDSNGEQFDEYTYSDNLIHGSFGLRPHPRVGIGITIKWMINAVPDILEDDKNLYAYGLGLDFAMQVQALDNLGIGLQFRDIDGKHSWQNSEVWGDDAGTKDDNLPTQVRFGGAWDPIKDLTILFDFVAYMQAAMDDNAALQPHVGAEWRKAFGWDKSLALRAGYNGREPAFGFGLKFLAIGVITHLDYAFILERASPGGSHLIGWVFEI